MTTTELDDRVHAYNDERRTADIALHDRLEGEWTWLTPRLMWAARGRVSLRARPDALAAQVSEALLGEAVEVLEELAGGWAWVRTGHDGYLGYARLDGLSAEAPADPVTVHVPRGHLYAAPKISAVVLDELAYGAQLSKLDPEPQPGGDYLWWRVAYCGGEAYLHAAATEPPEGGTTRSLAFLQRYLDVPYVWGGRSAWGIDCSGLAQLFCGVNRLPRDADQQQVALTVADTPLAGDLAFFPGHVGIMLDWRHLLHANATHMRVTIETLGVGAYGRKLQESLTGFGRLE